MKLPLSWMRDFVSVDAPVEEISRRLSFAGLVVEHVEKLTPGFAGVFAARVLNVEKHPNADRLNLVEVDAGEKGKFKVVCGAPNVKAGMTAPLALVGAQLGKEPPLEAAVIRGVQSEGMLCSERELGLSQDHAGILALGADAPLGGAVAAYLHLDDVVLDVEITPNRGDCLSILGLAREVAALFGSRLRAPRLRAAPSGDAHDGAGFAVAVSIDAPDLCPRYAALAMTGIKLGPSPAWLKRRLELCGMRALNNVVDATNYVMLELGQPLHAFDYAKIAGGKIVVRRAGETREFVTLDNITRALDPNDLLIADPDKPLAIAGVMGGLNSEVSDSTTTILLESAYFEPMTVARTSRRLGLRSEASYRFERGIDRAGQVGALIRAAELDPQNRARSRGLAHRRLRAAQSRAARDRARPRRDGIAARRAIPADRRAQPSQISRRASQHARQRRALSRAPVVPLRPARAGRPDRGSRAPRRPRGHPRSPAGACKCAGSGESRARVHQGHPRSDDGMRPDRSRDYRVHRARRQRALFRIQIAARPVKVTNPLSAELSELRVSLMPGLVTRSGSI